MTQISRRQLLTRAMTGAAAATLPFAGFTRIAEAATPKDTAVFAKQIDDIVTLDPGECYELSGIEIATNLYDRVLRYEAEDLNKLVGGAAQSWTVSADGKTFTFKLRQGLKFHSGAPVTAEDVVFSLQRVVLLNKTPAFLFTQLGWSKDNVKDLVTASDAGTVITKITADFAPSMVLNLMTSIVASVVEKKIAMANETNGDLGNAWLKTHSAGSGAFKLFAWKANESVSLEASPDFRMGAPHMKRVIVRHVPEPSSQRLQLEKGDVDFARDLSPDLIRAMTGNKDIKIEEFKGANTFYGAMNLAFEPFQNPKVRQAMKLLVDYQGLAGTVLKGKYFVQQSFLPLGFFGAIPYNPFKLDVARAKALLAEAGFKDGFTVKLAAPNSFPWTDVAQSIQQTLGQAGIKATLEMSERKTVTGNYRARKYEMTLTSWGPDYFDPHTNADTFAHNVDNSDNPKIRPLAWRCSWLIPEITQEMLAAAKELDSKKREQMYVALQKKVTDEGPFIFLFQNNNQIARRTNVSGFTPGITEDLDFYRTIRKS